MASEMTVTVGSDDIGTLYSPRTPHDLMQDYIGSSFLDGKGFARWTDLPSSPVEPAFTVVELFEVLAGRML